MGSEETHSSSTRVTLELTRAAAVISNMKPERHRGVSEVTGWHYGGFFDGASEFI